ncbi:PD-(D/E)XK nuclease family protein [Sphingomonadaceae bacterium OTU29THOMA1]|nr:PD-(D/E)XK nuclease family protein [Sphingomonadaceae bacterium OTU29THOMA1]
MKLIFGMACDGPSYPDFPGEGEGAIDAAIVGPCGLVEALEVELGLTRPRVPQAVRTAGYMACMRAAVLAAPSSFFAPSFSLDPWGTATRLLEWRDELIAGGWNGASIGSTRIDDLARIERLDLGFLPGIADRAHLVCRALPSRRALELRSLELAEPRELLPPLWQAVVLALESSGVRIEPSDAVATAAGDLGRVQTFLSDGGVSALEGDGSIVLVEADTELAAAEAVAEWFSHRPADEIEETVVIGPDGDTALLDQALRHRGLPALGLSAASPARGALQILPLAFAVTWAPFDAKMLLDLLLLPRSPVPQFAARRLARALSREPGTGGAAWASAWSEIEGIHAAREEGLATGDRSPAGQLDLWREWIKGGLYERGEGMPADAARAIAARVEHWAAETGAATGDDLLFSLAGSAAALRQAIDVAGEDHLPARLIDRMVDQVLAQGVGDPHHLATAGGTRALRDPGALVAPAGNVVWWNFRGPGSRVPASPWSSDETAALLAAGCRLEPPTGRAARIGRSHANAVRLAGERLILVCPAFLAGEETVSHPLSHRLRPIVAPAGEAVRWSAERLLAGSSHRLAGRDIVRTPLPRAAPPAQRGRWSLPSAVASRLEGRTESASSFERLVDCHVRWLVQDVLGVGRGRGRELPGTDQLVGNLAHEVACRVLPPGPVADPVEVQARAEALFDGLVAAIAAPLAQPGLAGELAAARTRVPVALSQLARRLRLLGVEVVGTEVEKAATFPDGLVVSGRLDLVVRHPVHGQGVIDLKWTKSARRRRNELAEGRAVQLATYGAIANEQREAHAPGAFYLLSQRRLIGPPGSFLADEVVAGGVELQTTWANLAASWRVWRDQARAGVAVATGVAGAADDVAAGLPMGPGTDPCRYCELTGLCRVGVETN